MPELPEVESVRRGLDAVATGRTITGVTVLHPRPVRSHLAGPDDFAHRLHGRTFGRPGRRGKFLWLPLTGGEALMAHLGMSGQFRVDDPAAPLVRNTRVLIDLDDGRQLRFVDQRMFGGLSISPMDPGDATHPADEVPAEAAHVARDPFDPLFDADSVVRRMKRSVSGVKSLLLNQTIVSGFGNIYADEALWRAGFHHLRTGDRMTLTALRDLLDHGRVVMAESLSAGGTSFDALYVNVNGESGYFARSLHAYGREGQPCDRCGAPIVREAFANRSSFSCPVCQPRPRRRRAV
ncbi:MULTISPECIES: bifunctional DNA-formamidopyrimidine glycosylase/DNA-(apurinic or apyrimidinic site) lyase [Aestuariimicrobium]|uniref:bifunctional DNA-formamidopyrimidine glycosylase/DNA-(apurinic or apyrimidinic site) lyase n=1 Tax=Aestuariimicrobium TaxID=396388 RepID=UPI0003B6D2D5|nr:MULTISPECIES: bifunctional DNA-formamidopyrimidine glycosylase/DNA-(apurinic or apyrimidinic site) lyase [Aestuariimicrobium]CAI9398761.1 Formamidopyrimidine-DNA glycosylase 1 [Aestuariimicrobium sp. T2.26MG-19.2B]